MKKLLLAAGVFIAGAAHTQTTLFSDNFESGSSNWTFNGSGDNSWVVNNAYLGYSPFIVDTPNQPGSFTGAPQSMYLHVVNNTICGMLGACNANFDTGSASNQNAQMASGVSTVGMNTVTVSFWYLCAGASGTSYGSLEYSIDGGGTWINAGNYSGISSWTQATVSLPAWDNQADFRIRFKWQNGGAGLDPAFAVDEMSISATPGGGSTSIATSTGLTPSSWCYGTTTNMSVPFTSSGTFSAGNVYTAQLSDATGSFASPTAVGTLSSTANTGTISAVIPGSVPVGSGYRIRVVSSNPATTGSDNGSNLVINALPTVSLGTFSAVCNTDPMFTLTGGAPAGGNYSGTGITANVFEPAVAGAGTHLITYTYVDGNACSASAQQSITVNNCSSLNELDGLSVLVYPNPASESFSIQTEVQIETLSLLDIEGRVVRSYTKKNDCSLEGLAPGSYFIQISDEKAQLIIKLIKQ